MIFNHISVTKRIRLTPRCLWHVCENPKITRMAVSMFVPADLPTLSDQTSNIPLHFLYSTYTEHFRLAPVLGRCFRSPNDDPPASKIRYCQNCHLFYLFQLAVCPWANIATAGLSMSYKLGPRWDDVITWSDFRSETIFGFLSPNYAGQHTWFFL